MFLFARESLSTPFTDPLPIFECQSVATPLTSSGRSGPRAPLSARWTHLPEPECEGSGQAAARCVVVPSGVEHQQIPWGMCDKRVNVQARQGRIQGLRSLGYPLIVRSPIGAKHHVVVQCMARWLKCPLPQPPPPPPTPSPSPHCCVGVGSWWSLSSQLPLHAALR